MINYIQENVFLYYCIDHDNCTITKTFTQIKIKEEAYMGCICTKLDTNRASLTWYTILGKITPVELYI